MSAADLNTGFFGKIPATGDFVAWNLPRTFIDRWDRWMSMELRARPDEGELDPRAWRFIIQEGIFGDLPCAGAWRMSEDRVGRRYPFAIVRLGSPPDPGDPWFDAIVEVLQRCVEDHFPQTRLTFYLQELLPPVTSVNTERIVFWSDDWEVKEFSFANIHDLADNALPAMRSAVTEVGAP
ncbi:type VI secretion system-associated protein TagF [Mesorhizobium sp. VK23B]|uniref:Type VI secretion system-associated protein TagF n=1 Tax=Mesorhizobium dulcispinae TaxID=3072316 RepID=A0ABU4XHC7_9HYPH|nr:MULTISPECIES: type VI secretion system-associated protein TagF [unclassified Mesorhizobium]MDX8467171.1 type VI secretion system-associated protein TagF [Mesorhizobium sp. VK23B]MDX8473195.1 type VI secretion system-associated protein TagF [Mesorhizobium sp. VK23A]